jgi:hypothetical protein
MKRISQSFELYSIFAYINYLVSEGLTPVVTIDSPEVLFFSIDEHIKKKVGIKQESGKTFLEINNFKCNITSDVLSFSTHDGIICYCGWDETSLSVYAKEDNSEEMYSKNVFFPNQSELKFNYLGSTLSNGILNAAVSTTLNSPISRVKASLSIVK